ncbi:hypothetical protein ACFL2U_03310 [Patescibacteria group bacterium]
MNFAELEQKVGKALAIAIAWKTVPKEVLDNLTFEQCLEVHGHACQDNIRHNIEEKALALANTVDDCLEIFEISTLSMNKRILEKAFSLAKTLEDCLKVYDIVAGIGMEGPLKDQVLTKAQGLVVTVKDALSVFEKTHLSPELKSFEKALEMAKTYEDAKLVSEAAFPGSDNKDLAIAKMLEVVETTAQCLEVYNYLKSDQKTVALAKGFTLASTFADYFQVYKYSANFSEQKKQAFTKVLETASTPRECLDIKIQSSDDTERELALKKAISLADSIEGYLSLYYYAGQGDVGNSFLDQALSLVKTTEECMIIYNSCDGGLPRVKAQEKMREIWQQSQ